MLVYISWLIITCVHIDQTGHPDDRQNFISEQNTTAKINEIAYEFGQLMYLSPLIDRNFLR
jgi:hypothetical protein